MRAPSLYSLLRYFLHLYLYPTPTLPLSLPLRISSAHLAFDAAALAGP